MKFIQIAILIISIAVLVIKGCNQFENHSNYNLIDSNQNGIEIVKAALEKHGDFHSDSMKIAFEIVCDEYFHPTQSQTPFHPMTSGFWNQQVLFSPANNLEIHRSKMKAGCYIFHSVAVLQNNQRLSYSINTKTYEENNFDFIRNLDLIPQTFLRKTLENKPSIKTFYSPDQTKDSFYLLEAFFDNSQHKLWIAQDSTLVRVENLRHSSTYGLGQRTYNFNYDQRINGYLLPTEISFGYANSVWGNVVNTFKINNINEKIIADFLEETSSYVPGDHSYRRNAEVIKLTDKIYLVENITSSSKFWSYNILFAEFNDHVLVTEAPVNDKISELVIEKIRETISDKPIKFIVQSHHHSDHIAGIKQYIDEGVTIVTTLNTSDVIKKINKAYQYTDRQPIEPQFHIVKQNLDLSDDSLTARIIDLGPTLHSHEMIIIYFPNERILFQADMINYGEWPIDNDISVEFSKKIKELELPIDMIVGVHGQLMHKKEVNEFLTGSLKNKFGK